MLSNFFLNAAPCLAELHGGFGSDLALGIGTLAGVPNGAVSTPRYGGSSTASVPVSIRVAIFSSELCSPQYVELVTAVADRCQGLIQGFVAIDECELAGSSNMVGTIKVGTDSPRVLFVFWFLSGDGKGSLMVYSGLRLHYKGFINNFHKSRHDHGYYLGNGYKFCLDINRRLDPACKRLSWHGEETSVVDDSFGRKGVWAQWQYRSRDRTYLFNTMYQFATS
ncbi:hypothetical protein F4802DRAFT_597479 [Xylaria palmicola]|nr:hypothetical protein F4802DRAFT_597479 [Xylaria palmicola]